jgi:alpha-acetolactate decarboxylase
MFKAGAMEGAGTLSVGKLTMRGDFKAGVLARGTITGADGRTFQVDIDKNEILEVMKDGSKRPLDELPPDVTI